MKSPLLIHVPFAKIKPLWPPSHVVIITVTIHYLNTFLTAEIRTQTLDGDVYLEKKRKNRKKHKRHENKKIKINIKKQAGSNRKTPVPPIVCVLTRL